MMTINTLPYTNSIDETNTVFYALIKEGAGLLVSLYPSEEDVTKALNCMHKGAYSIKKLTLRDLVECYNYWVRREG